MLHKNRRAHNPAKILNPRVYHTYRALFNKALFAADRNGEF